MQPEDMADKEVSRFSGGGELGKHHKVYSFGKPVDYDQGDSITM